MRIAIFGGTGFVGSYIVDALLTSGHMPSVLVRPGSEDKLQQADRCEIHAGDIDMAEAVNATLKRCDAAIYTIGILREFPSKDCTFEKLQYEGVARVVEAAVDCGVSRLLLMSANGVKSPGTRYQESKIRAEAYAKESGLDVTVVRPSVIFGDPRGTMEFATQLNRDMVASPLPAVGFFSGSSPAAGPVMMSPVHVRDVASVFVNCLGDPETIGKTYELGGPEELDWTEMLRRIAAATGRDKRVIPMPIGLMKVAATLLDWLPAFPVTRDQLTMLAEGNIASPAALTALIGEPPRPFSSSNLAYLNSVTN